MKKNQLAFLLLSIVFWFFLALFPWQSRLEEWMVVRFLIGVIIYLAPGVLTFLYLSEDKDITPRIFLGGFVVSIFVTGLLGIIARLFQLNFDFIRLVFALWGASMIFLFYLKPVNIVLKIEKLAWWEAILFAFTAVGVLYFASITEPPLIHDDAFTYNALIYYYQNAPVLDFNFPNSLSRLEIPRFWIAYWPLVEALISGFSGVDGLFIAGTLLPPLLAAFSFIGIYTLGRTLDLPRLMSAAAVLAQGFSLMRLTGNNNQPGYLFFQRLTEDKVVAAFVISLTLILLVIEYLKKSGMYRLLLAGIAALAMAFTHPVQFGMTSMIIGTYGLPMLFNRKARGRYLLLIGILAVFLLIPYLFRFGGGDYSQSLSFSLEDVAANDEFKRLGSQRVDIIEGTMFYGVSRYLTTGLPYEAGLAAALISLFFFWRNNAARYVLASFLVLGVSMFPYTGWIVGMFTTPFQLWRLTWLMPFGLAFVFLIWLGFEMIQKTAYFKKRTQWLQPAYYFSVFAMLSFAIVYVRPWALENVANLDLDVSDIYSNYVSTAAMMNELDVDSAIIIGGPDAVTNSVIPSLTMKYTPLVFRVESGGEQTKLWKSLMGDDILSDVRLARLRESKVEYLLLKGEPDWVSALLNKYPDNISRIFRNKRFSLYKLTY